MVQATPLTAMPMQARKSVVPTSPIGSAGWFGHGLTGGSQSEFQLLKVRETDFIFAHAMSMFGFVGGLAFFFTLASFGIIQSIVMNHRKLGFQAG